MKTLCALLVIGPGIALAQQAPDASVQNQWFTGSLEAPSPALSTAGAFAVEPYAIITANTGAYDGHGRHYAVARDLTEEQSDTSIKYGITNRLTLQVSPSFAHVAAGGASATGVGDLPVELEYRFNEENGKTGWPSLTVELGNSFATGAYQNLPSAGVALGSGVNRVKAGVLLQSLFDSGGGHPMRFRLYAAGFEPWTDASLHNVSAYGTALGFHGQAKPGSSAEVGLGAGYAFSQRWVLAMDVLENYAGGSRVAGETPLGGVHSYGPASATLSLAPAVEYNWTGNLGIIVGVEYSAAGRNTASYIAPQIALSTSF